MNEVTKIHLGRQPFTISVEAYKLLKEYLDAIKHRVGSKGADVVEEVELRIVELLAERGVTGEKVILAKDVEYLKEQLGKPGDFSDGPDEADEEPPKDGAERRLFRDPEHGIVAGVAAGLASYLKIDAVFVRLAFVVLTFVWAWGIALYIVLWLITPEVKTKSDRLRSQGKAVTVSSLKSVVERADVPAATQRVTRGLRQVVQGIMRVLLVILGVGFMITGISSLLGVMTAGLYMLLRPEHAFQEDIFLVNGTEVLVVVLALVAAAIFCAFLLMIGMAMLRRKWSLPGWVGATMVGVLLVSIATGAALVPGIAQDVKKRYEAAHHVTKEVVAPFAKLKVIGDENTAVNFVQSSSYGVEFKYFGGADPKLLKRTVTKGVLTVDPTAFIEASRCTSICLYDDSDMEIVVRAPSFQEVEVEGLGTSFEATRLPAQKNLTVYVNQGAYVHLGHVYAGKVEWSDGAAADKLLLTNLRADATPDDFINMGNGASLSLQRTDELVVKTLGPCDIYTGPAVYVTLPPRKVEVNGKVSDTAEEMESMQKADDRSGAGCVQIELLKPTQGDFF